MFQVQLLQLHHEHRIQPLLLEADNQQRHKAYQMDTGARRESEAGDQHCGSVV